MDILLIPPHIVEVKNAWNCASAPLYVFLNYAQDMSS
jgi:hypothetical protein